MGPSICIESRERHSEWRERREGGERQGQAIDNDVMPNSCHVPLCPRFDWLRADLAAARARGIDWLIVYAHRPMYCSNVDDMPDCSKDAEQLRDGYLNLDGTREYGLEQVLGEFSTNRHSTNMHDVHIHHATTDAHNLDVPTYMLIHVPHLPRCRYLLRWTRALV